MIDLASVQNLLHGWWFEYDQGNFDIWPGYFTDDVHFFSRSDLGNTPHEEFFRADLHGHDAVLEWQVDHRLHSPYPLRHNTTNVHLTGVSGDEATFRSYIFVSQIVNGAVSPLSTGLATGTVRDHGGTLRIAELKVILDMANSEPFDAAPRAQAT
jgi:SnoaL-like domain